MNYLSSKQTYKPILVCLAFFTIAALLGLTMRAAFVLDMPMWYNYRNVQHAHSHVALLGWLFAIFYIIIIQIFGLKWNKYNKLFWGLQTTVLGMLLTFPVIGYNALSITFSSIHTLLAFVFVYKVWTDVRVNEKSPLPVLFLKASLFFLVLSELGPLSLGPIIGMGLKGTPVYYASIQFYLHFQFNGWFIFALLAILLELLRSRNIILNSQKGKQFFWTLLISAVLTFALALTWSTPRMSIFLINSIGILLQLLALVLFIRLVITKKALIKNLLNTYAKKLLYISLLAVILKILIQSVVVIPQLAEVSYTIRNLVIGFIHLLMLGGLSLFALSMISEIIKRPLNTLGTVLFILGIIITELLLFGQGFMQWQGFGFLPFYYELITITSLFMVLGIIVIFYNFWYKKQVQL